MVVKMAGYYVNARPTTTRKKERMYFGTFIDQEGTFFDTVHFPPSLVHSPFEGRGIYVMEGKVVKEYNFYFLEIKKMKRWVFQNAGRIILPWN